MIRFGFDVGGTHIRFAVFDEAASAPLWAKRADTPVHDRSNFYSTIQKLFDEACSLYDRPERLGFSVPGAIHPDTKILITANIPCISNINLGAELEDLLDLTVNVANDADCFVLSEYFGGEADGKEFVFGLIMGTGIGGGIIINGKPFQGRSGSGGEWGHGGPVADLEKYKLPVLECGCGQKGCLDLYCGGKGLTRMSGFFGKPGLDAVTLVKNWKNGDIHATRVIEAWCDLTSSRLAAVLSPFDISSVPVGGGLAKSQDLIRFLDKATREKMFNAPITYIIKPGKFLLFGGMRGAAFL